MRISTHSFEALGMTRAFTTPGQGSPAPGRGLVRLLVSMRACDALSQEPFTAWIYALYT